MESVEVLPSATIDSNNAFGYKQSTEWTLEDILASDDFVGLSSACYEDDHDIHFSHGNSLMNISADITSVLLSDAGTTLAEMLQTESVLQSTDVSNSTSCTLAQLLTSECATVDNNNIANISSSPKSYQPPTEHFTSGVASVSSTSTCSFSSSRNCTVSDHTLSTAGTLLKILQTTNPTQAGTHAVTYLSTHTGYNSHKAIPSTVSIPCLETSAHSAESVFNIMTGRSIVSKGCMDEMPDAMAIALAEDNGLFPNLEERTLALLNGDESNISFENGIEATDMCSLLEQFEAAECFPGVDGLGPSLSEELDMLNPLDIGHDIKMETDDIDQEDFTSEDPFCMDQLLPETSSDFCCFMPSPIKQIPISPDSEVVRLLKAPPARAHVQNTGPVLSQSVSNLPRPARSPRNIQKMKTDIKRKGAILLADPPALHKSPNKTITNSYSDSAVHKLLRMGENNKGNNLVTDGSKKMDHENNVCDQVIMVKNIPCNNSASSVRDLLKGCDNSGQSSPSDSNGGSIKKMSLLEYRQRLKQRLAGINEDSTDSTNSSFSNEGGKCVDFVVNRNYFEKILDHDYCQNVPVPIKSETNENELVVKDAVIAKSNEHNRTLKTLLLNKNLSEELKKQAVKDREVTQRNMQTANDASDQPVIEFNSSRKQQPRSQRNYRARDESSTKMFDNTEHDQLQRNNLNQEDDQRNVYDKLPSYCTTLSTRPIPGMTIKKQSSSSRCIDTSLPERDRDPSPDRIGPTFNKVPAYFSCFTNSTRYDKTDPLSLTSEPYPWDRIRSNISSHSGSRCTTPVFTAGDRSRSCSRSRRSSDSRSSSSDSKSPKRAWRSYGKRGSLSSRSRSRSSDSCNSQYLRKRSRSRSNSRSYRSHSRHISRSRSRSHESRSRSHRSRSYTRTKRIRKRSRSASYGTYKRGSRADSRERFWHQYREEMTVKRSLEKTQQIKERRIVYIGRIPTDMNRRTLRRTFEQFGDIEEVSVHFREQGDNYGFVTYRYTCDAYAAIEKGNSLKGCESYDLCFGGRRQFCETDYADLDGNKEDEEELGPLMGNSSKDLDFDALLKQAQKKMKK